MAYWRLDQLNARLRKQAEAQLCQSPTPRKEERRKANTPKPAPTETKADKYELTPYHPTSVSRPPHKDSRGTPNKTEAEYNATMLGGLGRYEPIILKMPGGNYTPDWMTIDDGVVTFHEVKGAYRFGSESRAVLAFLSAAAAYPFWSFVWAQKRKDGTWDVKRAVKPTPQNTLTTPTEREG